MSHQFEEVEDQYARAWRLSEWALRLRILAGQGVVEVLVWRQVIEEYLISALSHHYCFKAIGLCISLAHGRGGLFKLRFVWGF